MLKKTRLFLPLTSKWHFNSFWIYFMDPFSSYCLSFPQFVCRNLVLEFHSSLSDKRKRPVAILIDGVDLVQDGTGQPNSEWIPQQLPRVSHHQKHPHKHTKFKSVIHLLHLGT